MANVLGRCRLVISHHTQPRSQGLQHHIAEGFGQAGKHENIARCIVGSQGFAAVRAAENSVGQRLLQGLALWAVADDDQLYCSLWIRRGQRVDGALEQTEVFLGCQAPDMNNGNVLLAQAPLFTQ